jgi:glucokinase
MSQSIGIEIGGTKLQLVLGDKAAQILRRIRLAIDPGQGAEGIRRQIEQTLPQLLQAGTVSAIGVGFGGPVDWRTGRIARSHQIEGWSGFDLAGWLRRLSGLPVQADNDANVAALGEARRGAGRGLSPALYVTLGSGVGGGLVVDDRLYHGVAPGESELGHVRLDRQGTILESRCSGWAVDARLRQAAAENPTSALSQLISGHNGGEAKHLAAALAVKDPDAEHILKDTAADLAFGLSHAVHLFHPAIIVLGGGLSLIGEPLREAVESALPPFLMEVFRPGPIIALSALGEDAVPVGALELARDLPGGACS